METQTTIIVPVKSETKDLVCSGHFTPGPWKICQLGEDQGQLHIRKQDDSGTSYVARLWDIALCEEHGDFKANARLIAAAPELLEALNATLPWLSLLGDFIGNGVMNDKNSHGTPLGPMGRCEAIAKVKDAITRATGE